MSTVDHKRHESRAGSATVDCPHHCPHDQSAKVYQNLSAVIKGCLIKGCLRLNPALAFSLERVVPAGGLQLDDTFIPPGTIVGVDPWVLHRDTRVFGSDARPWRRGRSLLEDADQVKRMDQHILAFGAGKRTCQGRNIAMLELTNLVPAVLIRYDISLARPGAALKVGDSFAVSQ